MGPIIYDSASIYVQSAANKVDRINRLTAIIDALEAAALTAAGNETITDYQLNDGQVVIKATYKSASSIANSIQAFEALRTKLINQLNGRVTRLVDGKNFNGRNFTNR